MKYHKKIKINNTISCPPQIIIITENNITKAL